MTALRNHGGRVDLAAAQYPAAPRPWLDLSTGINPCPWAPAVPRAIDATTLPSPDALRELEAEAARVFGAAADRVVAVPGSEIGLRLLDTLDLPSPARFVSPSYGTHAEAIRGASPCDRAEIDRVASGTLLLANPNNPDGLCDPPERLLAAARRGVWLIVDEAFADVAPETSIIPHLGADDRVIVFRSFGKFFGLAGLRLGFAIAPLEQAAAIRRRLGSWPISAHALAYGLAAYRDTHWIAATRASLRDRAARLDTVLARHGLQGRGACPLFRLIDRPDAAVLFERLARAGILTRPFDYAPHWLRIGVPADDLAFDRLDRAFGDG